MPNNVKAINALKNHKAEEEQQKHNDIVQALTRIKNGQTTKIKLKSFGKVSVKDLAIESGVSRASLYGNHKKLLEKLDKINKKRSTGVTEERKLIEAKQETDKEIIRELTRTRELLAQENYRINTENRKLIRQIESLASQLDSKSNVSPIVSAKSK